ncbi:MAG: hypothetical protein WKG07_25490 [Hymenobacter sp.]
MATSTNCTCGPWTTTNSRTASACWPWRRPASTSLPWCASGRCWNWCSPDPAGPAPLGCFLVNATTERLPHDADTAALVRQSQQFLEMLLTEMLAQGQARGETGRAATPQAQAQLLISVLNGMRVMAQANSDPQVLRNVVETVLLGLA